MNKDLYCELAERIWKDVSTARSNPEFFELSAEAQVQRYVTKYPKFALEFILPLKWMVNRNAYNKYAFKKYIANISDERYKTKEEYCSRQADYIEYLYMETKTTRKTKIDKIRAKKVRNSIYDILVSELKDTAKKDEERKARCDAALRNQINATRETLLSLTPDEPLSVPIEQSGLPDSPLDNEPYVMP